MRCSVKCRNWQAWLWRLPSRNIVGHCLKSFTPTAKQKAEVDRLIDKWRPLLFLSAWTIDLKYAGEADDDDSEVAATAADICADWVYSQATITFYPGYFKELEWKREKLLVHELCHCITEPTRFLSKAVMCGEKLVSWREYRETNERVTQHIASALHSLDFYLRRDIKELQRKRRKNSRSKSRG